MNKRGFTLVELLATIIILALIMVIAVPSINGVSHMIREKARENVVKNIENKAAKYAFDTGKTLIFVEELVKEGYILGDNNTDFINDPVNNQKMNCNVVVSTKNGSHYKAKFMEKVYETNGVCDLSKFSEEFGEINIEVLNDGVRVTNTNKWLKGSVSLNVYSNNILIDCLVNKCLWTSSSGLNIQGVDQINVDNIHTLNSRYNFQMSTYQDGKVKRYNASVNLMIDNEAPVIDEDNIIITDRYINTSYKIVTINASDGKGSGIRDYYMGINNGESCLNSEIVYQTSNTFNINKNGNYLICVRDNVGNISDYNININNIG